MTQTTSQTQQAVSEATPEEPVTKAAPSAMETAPAVVAEGQRVNLDAGEASASAAPTTERAKPQVDPTTVSRPHWLLLPALLTLLVLITAIGADMLSRLFDLPTELAVTLLTVLQGLALIILGSDRLIEIGMGISRQALASIAGLNQALLLRWVWTLGSVLALLLVVRVGLWSGLARLFHERGMRQYEQGLLATAEESFRRALRVDPAQVASHYQLGVVYEDQLEFERARAEYLLAVQGSAPQDVSDLALNNLARLYILNQQHDLAVPLLLRGLERAQDNATRYSIRKNLGWARLGQGPERFNESLAERLSRLQAGSASATPTPTPEPTGSILELPPFFGGDEGAEQLEQLGTIQQLLEAFRDPSQVSGEGLLALLAGEEGMASAENLVFGSARAFEPLFLNNIGETYREQGEAASATQHYREALDVIATNRASGDEGLSNVFAEVVEGLVYNNLGLAQSQAGDTQAALDAFDTALDRMRWLKQRLAIASVLTNRGAVQRQIGETDAALADFREALDLIETVRVVADSNVNQIVTGDGAPGSATQALSGAITQQVDIYNYTIDLYLEQAKQVDAVQREAIWREVFHIAERGRARLFLDLLNREQLALAEPLAAKLLAAERRAFILRQAAEDAYNQALVLEPPSPLLSSYEEQQLRAAAAYSETLRALEAHDQRLLTFVAERGGVLDVAGVQARLDDQSAMIVYYTFDQRIFPERPGLAFVLSRDTFSLVELPAATPTKLSEAVAGFQDWLRVQVALAQRTSGLAATPSTGAQATAPAILQSLYDMLLRPVFAQTRLDQPLLAIVPHQQLHYVPFAALNDGERYLIDAHALYNLPSASMLQVVQQNKAATAAAAPAKAMVC